MLSRLVDMLGNFNTITLINNQEKNLEVILDSYNSQSFKPDNFIFVLDRCLDSSKKIIQEFSKYNNTIIVENSVGSGFMAGFCRDFAYSKYNTLPVIFLDGDCVPSKDLFKEFSLEFSRNKRGVVIGSRKLETPDNTIEDDRRCTVPWMKEDIFNINNNMNITKTYLAKPGMITWSCCLGITPEAAKTIYSVNERITGNRRVFSSSFDGKYGGEDDIVGIISMFYNIPISSIASKHFVLHKYHESRKKEEFQDRINAEYTKIEQLALKDNAPGLIHTDFDYAQYVFDYSIRRFMN